jgi:hypothetical protein
MIAKKITFIEEITDVPINKDRLLTLIVDAIMSNISKEIKIKNKNLLTKSDNV